MNQKKLAVWLKIIVAGIGLCGAVLYVFVIPHLGNNVARDNPEYAFCYWPWLVFLWATALPCYAALVLLWRIAADIGRDRSFSAQNGKRLRVISLLAAGDCLVFFLGNLVFLFLDMGHPGVLLFSLAVIFAGIAVAVVSAVLSHLVAKAGDLQEQSDLTI